MTALALVAQPAAAWNGKFYDSATYEFPEGATHVMEYADGDFTPAKTGHPPMRTLYPYVHDITVTGQSWHAQFADYELYNPVFDVPGRCRAWVEQRITRGLRSVPYCDRYDLHRLHQELGPVLWTHSLVRFWIPTLDGRQWTPDELSANIAQFWGVYISPARLLANQYAGEGSGSGGPWDISNLFGMWY